MIVDGAQVERHVEDAFDYVIVGSGASGATVARVLADTGCSVAVVEEGPALTEQDFEATRFAALSNAYRAMGAQVTKGLKIPVLQGCCLGGSTVVNSAIMWRLPEDVWQEWAEGYGLGTALPLEALHHFCDQIERELSVAPTPSSVLGGNNGLMATAAAALAINAGPTRRAVRDCRGSARCQSGCPFGAKQSMALTYLRHADERGAVLFTRAQADKIVLQADRAVAVEGRLGGPDADRPRHTFRIGARKAVIVAASAIQTPGLLHRSGIRSRHLGAHLQLHLGALLIGLFDHDVNMWSGATQGFESDQHRRDGRFKVESLAPHPELLMAQLPGVGPRWLENIGEARRMAVWDVDLRAEAEGTVHDRQLGPWRGTCIRYTPSSRDMARLGAALHFTAQMLFAAGAREVLPGVYGRPERIRRAEELAPDSSPGDARAYSLVASHLFGTARMAAAAEAGVVGTDFTVHGKRGLYVADSSIFPTNIGVNPQLSIMAVAMHAAKTVCHHTL
jgi:choline dehydrogenase-like flavoprotein